MIPTLAALHFGLYFFCSLAVIVLTDRCILNVPSNPQPAHRGNRQYKVKADVDINTAIEKCRTLWTFKGFSEVR